MSKKNNETGFGIKIEFDDGVTGWLTGEGGNVRVFQTQKDAEKFLKQLKMSKYSWTHATISVVEYE